MNGTLPKTNHVRARWRADSDEPYSRIMKSASKRAPSPRTACIAASAGLLLLLLFNNLGVRPPRYHASEVLSNFFDGSSRSGHSSDDPITAFRVSSDSKGLCRAEYSVATFDGRYAPVCNAQLCESREKLKILDDIPHTRRWSAVGESQYMDLYNAQNIDGWLQAPHIEYVKKFTEKQHEMGIYGAVGEIGVHHGKFLIPIVGNSLVDEPAVAMDLFEDQSANIDQSGQGSKARLLQNLEACGITKNSITLAAGNSMFLSAKNFTSKGWPAFRLLSVDGGHTLEVTLHDLMVASCLVRDGGLVVLDDFPNTGWIGVTEALMHFSHAQDRLVPFLHGYSKIWLATKSHVQEFRNIVAEDPKVFTCMTEMHESRRAVAGHAMCYTGSAT